jgi:hypothetical protein
MESAKKAGVTEGEPKFKKPNDGKNGQSARDAPQMSLENA